MRRFVFVICWGISLTLGAGAARGGATAPHLVLSAASGAAAGANRAAVFDGTFDFENALQLGYPLSLVVFQGSRFVRYPLAGAAVDGTSPELADGVLDPAEIAAVQQEGAGSAAGVGIVGVTPTRLRVTLPATFTAGATQAILVTILPEGPLVSNPIGFTLP